jgi:hypothetical protein
MSVNHRLFCLKSPPFALFVLGLWGFSLLPSIRVQAASLGCGTGANWVSTCQGGQYVLSNHLVNFLNIFSPNNQVDFTVSRSGLTTLALSDPLDAIVNDPFLGNVGVVDGVLDVVRIEVTNSVSAGLFPVPNPYVSTAIFGDGVSDFAPTPPDTSLPYESLYSAGAIVQRPDNPMLADSFINIFTTALGAPQGKLRNRSILRVDTSSPLTTFPVSLGGSVLYESRDITALFLAGADGQFWHGDEIEFAQIVPGSLGQSITFSLSSVPETSLSLGSIIFGLVLGTQIKRKEEK